MHNKKTTKMPRLAILAVTLGALSWSGDAFVSPIASSETTIREASNLPRCHTPCKCHSPYSVPRRRGRPQEVSANPHFSSSNLYSAISHRRSSSLDAVLLNDSSSSGRGERGGRGQKPDGTDKKGPGWHRRILGKIPWRRQSQGLRPGGGPKYVSSSSLPSASVEQERPDLLVESYGVYRDDFVVQNFDALTPESVLPVVQVNQRKKMELLPSKPHSSSKLEVDSEFHRPSSKPPTTLDSEYLDVSITPAVYDAEGKPRKKGGHTKKNASSSLATRTRSSNSNANASRKGMIGRVLQNILTERIGQRWTTESPERLKVDVRSSPDKYYNNLGRLLFKGLYRADATLSSGRIVFPNIRFSSVRFELEQVTLNLMGFFSSTDSNANQNQDQGRMPQQQQKGQKQKQKRHQATDTVRYPNQFDIHIEDLTMSRHDLLFSSCIKNGLRGLLINILKDRGVRSNSIRITSIDILPNGKISCFGEAKTHFVSAPPVQFEVRSGISCTNRGHVLTFPGLEVSLNRDIGLFVPVHPTLDLDVGHNTKFRSIVIDGHQKRLKITASVTITPDRTRLLTQDYVQTSEAFSAIFFYDIGQWLTRLGKFSK